MLCHYDVRRGCEANRRGGGAFCSRDVTKGVRLQALQCGHKEKFGRGLLLEVSIIIMT